MFLCALHKNDSIDAILGQNDSKVVTDAAKWMKHLFTRYKNLPANEKAKTPQAKFRAKVVDALVDGRWLTHHDQMDKEVKDWLGGANNQP